MCLLHSSFFPILLPLKKFDGNQISHGPDLSRLIGRLLSVHFVVLLMEHIGMVHEDGSIYCKTSQYLRSLELFLLFVHLQHPFVSRANATGTFALAKL